MDADVTFDVRNDSSKKPFRTDNVNKPVVFWLRVPPPVHRECLGILQLRLSQNRGAGHNQARLSLRHAMGRGDNRLESIEYYTFVDPEHLEEVRAIYAGDKRILPADLGLWVDLHVPTRGGEGELWIHCAAERVEFDEGGLKDITFVGTARLFEMISA